VLELWPGWLAGGSGGHYPLDGGGGQYPSEDGSGHVGCCPATGEPSHGITGGGPI
jgi:hypothetical protein